MGNGEGLRKLGLFLFYFCGKESTMKQYVYEGPVMEFDRCVMNHWKGTTVAVSEKKARSNLTYQYKKNHGKMPTCKISLPGKIIEQ